MEGRRQFKTKDNGRQKTVQNKGQWKAEDSSKQRTMEGRKAKFVCWLVGCLTSQQQASVSQGRICSDNLTCCHTEIEVADQTFYLTQSQYTDTGPTSPTADPITPGAWQSSHWSANFEITGMTQPWKNPGAKQDSNLGSSALEADALPLGQRGGGRAKGAMGGEEEPGVKLIADMSVTFQ